MQTYYYIIVAGKSIISNVYIFFWKICSVHIVSLHKLGRKWTRLMDINTGYYHECFLTSSLIWCFYQISTGSHYRYTSSSICILFYLFSHTFCYGIHYLIPYFAVKRYIVKYRYIWSFIQIKIILTTRLSLLNCFSFLNFKNNLPPKRLKAYCAYETADRGDVCISCYSTSC